MLESLENNLIEVKNASSELTLHSFERRKECLEILSKKLIEMILNIRNDAKANKNYQVSDQIRDELNKIGIEIKDGKDNTTYSIND